MDWKIVLRKFAEGAAAGAMASLAAINLTGKDNDVMTIALSAVVVGALRGGINALKHMGK